VRRYFADYATVSFENYPVTGLRTPPRPLEGRR
jgi:hypothetical protein